MKAKLLKKLRNRGRSMIYIYSVTRSGDTVTGMKYGYDFPEYRGLFFFGNTEHDVREKAARIYIKTNIESIRKKYRT